MDNISISDIAVALLEIDKEFKKNDDEILSIIKRLEKLHYRQNELKNSANLLLQIGKL